MTPPVCLISALWTGCWRTSGWDAARRKLSRLRCWNRSSNSAWRLRPRRILLTHLDEFGRGIADLWEEAHARRVCEALRQRSPGLPVTFARMGDSIELD